MVTWGNLYLFHKPVLKELGSKKILRGVQFFELVEKEDK